jgi:hypothetical protein
VVSERNHDCYDGGATPLCCTGGLINNKLFL